ncbi:MAG: hypothetical protein OEP45_04185 [Acidobacteriota bacterium]|nr:hypothetical protein [Acidobacteriota bacterium]
MTTESLSQTLRDFLRQRGPALGVDLVSLTGQDVLTLAGVLGADGEIHRDALATCYLRIDEDSPDGARMSPSFLRKFVSFTCFGTDEEAVRAAVRELGRRHAEISRRKRELGAGVGRDLLAHFRESLSGDLGVLICGDVVYDLAHDSPRRERSTDIPVRGSDIDLIVVLEDADAALRPDIEAKLLEIKYFWLKHPRIAEELDFIVKTPTEISRQLGFETVKDKIAMKILAESEPLLDSGTILERCAAALAASEVSGRLAELEKRARRRQRRLEADVYSGRVETLDAEAKSIFFSVELDELGEFSRSRQSLIALKP